MIIINIAIAMAAWCSDPDIIPSDFASASEISIFYDDRASLGYTLSSTSMRGDGTFGINVPIDSAVRSIRSSVNIINSDVSADIPKLTYVGPRTVSTVLPTAAIVVTSPPASVFASHCGAQLSCVLRGGSSEPSYIFLKPTETLTTWRTSQGRVNTEVSATINHHIFSLLGLRNSQDPGGPLCPMTGIYPYDKIRTDGAYLPRSVMNTDAAFQRSGRYIYRDDIEGLRDLWGAKSHVLKSEYRAVDPAGAWTLSSDVPENGLVRTQVAASSGYASPDDGVSAVAFSSTGDRVHAYFRSGGNEWEDEMLELAPSGASFAKPAIAYGNNSVLVAWIDESDKSCDGINGGFPRVRYAQRAVSGGSNAWSFGYMKKSDGSLIKPYNPQISLGYSPQSNKFILVTSGEGKDEKPYVFTFTTASVVGLTNGSPIPSAQYHSAIGRPVCTSTSCVFPYIKNVDRSAPAIYFASGTISSSGWSPLSDVSGGYLAYSSVDQSYSESSGQYAIVWQSLSGKSVVHRRNNSVSPIDSSAEKVITTSGPQVALVSNRESVSSGVYHNALFCEPHTADYDDDGTDDYGVPDPVFSYSNGVVRIQPAVAQSPISVSVVRVDNLTMKSRSYSKWAQSYGADMAWEGVVPVSSTSQAYVVSVAYDDVAMFGVGNRFDNVLFFDNKNNAISWAEWACERWPSNCELDEQTGEIKRVSMSYKKNPRTY